MMTEDDYKHFVCIVAGDNPSDMMNEYDKNKHIEKQIVYKYSDASLLRSQYLQAYNIMLSNNTTLTDSEREYIKMTIDDISDMSVDDFYYDLVTDYEIDEKTGDAITYSNKNGKWSSYQIGKIFSVPFLLKDGRETFQAKKSDIDWDKIHLHDGEIYKRAWEMVVDGSKPENDYEQQIYENMQDKKAYFLKFETKENYVTSNTAFWGYAFLSDTTGWIDADNCSDQYSWMSNYFDMFIKNLDDNTLLTIYECKK